MAQDSRFCFARKTKPVLHAFCFLSLACLRQSSANLRFEHDQFPTAMFCLSGGWEGPPGRKVPEPTQPTLGNLGRQLCLDLRNWCAADAPVFLTSTCGCSPIGSAEIRRKRNESELTVTCTCSVMLVREEFSNLSWCVLDWFAQVGPNMSQLLTYVWCEILRQPRNMQNESMCHQHVVYCIHVHIYTHMFIYIYICICIYTYRRIHARLHVHAHVQSHIYLHMYIYIYSYIYIHALYINKSETYSET